MKLEINVKNKKELTDIVFLMAMQGLNYLMPLLVFPYLMLVLGAEKFGYIGFSSAVVQYMMLFVDFGFNFSATKRIVAVRGDSTEINKIFTSTLYAKIILLAISYTVLILISLVPKFAIYRSTMWVMSLMAIGNTVSFVWLFQGLGKIRMISIFTMIAKLSILPLTFVFVKTAEDFLKAAFLQSFVMIFAAIITVFYIFKNKMAEIVKVTVKNVKEETKESFPLFVATFCSAVYVSLFVVILGYFSSAQEVGKYAAAEKVIRVLCYIVFTPTIMAFYPKISELSKHSRSEAISLIRKILIVVTFLMIVLFFVLFLFSGELMQFLGKDYAGMDSLFKVMAIIPLFIAVGGVCGQLGLLALGDNSDKKRFQQVYFVAAVVALISVFVLTFFYQSLGAAVALLITELVVCVLMVYNYRKLNHHLQSRWIF